jgi:hypothetical protein
MPSFDFSLSIHRPLFLTAPLKSLSTHSTQHGVACVLLYSPSSYRAASEAFLAAPSLVQPLADLRRPDLERETWAPPKVKKREADVLAAGNNDTAASKTRKTPAAGQ